MTDNSQQKLNYLTKEVSKLLENNKQLDLTPNQLQQSWWMIQKRTDELYSLENTNNSQGI